MRCARVLPGAVICEVIDEQGEMARGQRLFDFADRWGLGIITVDAVVCARKPRAAKVGAIHSGAADRKKSRLSTQLNRLAKAA